jgi:hypothetical protein
MYKNTIVLCTHRERERQKQRKKETETETCKRETETWVVDAGHGVMGGSLTASVSVLMVSFLIASFTLITS